MINVRFTPESGYRLWVTSHSLSLPTVRASIVVLRVQNFDAVGSLGHGRIVRQPRPFDCGLAFIRPLRRRAALVVEYAGSDRATSPRPWQQSPW